MCTATNKNRSHKQMITKNKDSRSSFIMLPVNFKPNDNDVLCGRGNVYSNHYGNQFFGKVIRENISVYKEATSRPDKIKVVDGILDEIRDNGARFTKVDTQTERWYELNDVQAHQKIGHAIRDTIRLLGKENNDNNKKKKNNNIITSNYTPKNKMIAGSRRTIKSSVAKKKMFQQKRLSRITIQREQQKQLVRSTSSMSSDIDDILKISLDTIEFSDDIFLHDDSVVLLEQQENDDDYYYCNPSLLPSASASATCTLLEGYININNNNKESLFLLENEFPEQQFSFKANHFFEKNNDNDEIISSNNSNSNSILSQ
jgi:hypothetical protein